ncbi:MAG: cytochrome ubiquinol oxidase subunit I, partial [Candidatus Dormibacteria bacterium]
FTQITFVVFVFEAGTFIAEVVLLYALYANWNRLRRFRRARLGLLILLNLSQWWQMFFINVVASYMLTPNGGDTSILRQLLNPTDLPLTLHRTVGNVAWAGGLIAAVAGFRYLQATRDAPRATRTAPAPLRSVGAMAAPDGGMDMPGRMSGGDGEAAYWDWAGQWGLLWAFGLTLVQPWIGYSYAKEVQLHSYDSWYAMMLGGLSNTFLLQLGLLGLIFVLGALYFARRLKAEGLRLWRRHMVVAVLLIAVTLFAVQPAWFASTHDDIVAAHRDQPWWEGGLRNPLGNFIPYKVACLFLMVIIGVYALTSYLRARQRGLVTMGKARRGSQGLLLGLGATVLMMMSVMGVIRESSREPYLINGELTIQHQDTIHPVSPGGATPAPGPSP